MKKRDVSSSRSKMEIWPSYQPFKNVEILSEGREKEKRKQRKSDVSSLRTKLKIRPSYQPLNLYPVNVENILMKAA